MAQPGGSQHADRLRVDHVCQKASYWSVSLNHLLTLETDIDRRV